MYRAERREAGFAQQVAIKLISVAVAQPATGRRFRAERQILASLRHPHIVTLMDGGVTPEGLGYLVMEYVEGASISTYCRTRSLSLPERLSLFRQVCSAVHYAHRHFVVHRDLKPTNILMSSDGVPKVLDFGIAKLLDDPDAATATTQSPFGLGPLTPNYASPEQVRGLPVTTSSDIYALGVVLFELLTGSRPYETTGKTLEDVTRLVADIAPPRPSAMPPTADAGIPYDASRALQGDLDAIVLRAMAKEPERRYGSAEELADDVGRYLQGKPIVAREPSLRYVARKLARRHKAAFVSAGVSALVVLTALVVAIWQAGVATAEQRRAQRRFDEVRRLANALVFDIHDAVAPLAGSTPVRQKIVAQALQYLEGLAPEAGGDPALQVELARAYVQIGKVQGVPGSPNLGDREGAIGSLTKARAMLAPLAMTPDASIDTLSHYIEATRRLSSVLSVAGRREPARAAALDAVAVAEACFRRHPDDDRVRGLVGSANFQAASATGWPDALPLWRRAGAVYEELLAKQPDHPERLRNVALVEKYLGAHFTAGNDDAGAVPHHQRALALDEKRLAKDPGNRTAQFDVAIDLANVAESMLSLGHPASAAGLYERSLSLRTALAASDPSDALARSRMAHTHGQLARVYRQLGELPRAYDHGHAAVSIYESSPRSDPGDRRDLARAIWALGDIETARGRRRDACARFSRAFDVMIALPESVRRTGAAMNEDRLVELGTQAAACGVAAAQKWVAARQGTPH